MYAQAALSLINAWFGYNVTSFIKPKPLKLINDNNKTLNHSKSNHIMVASNYLRRKLGSSIQYWLVLNL